jgi:hypothetical protein
MWRDSDERINSLVVVVSDSLSQAWMLTRVTLSHHRANDCTH